MKKEKKIKIEKHIIQLDDIRKATEFEPEPPQEFEGTIPNGKCDEMIKKIISEANKG